jgi:hypothetical protein
MIFPSAWCFPLKDVVLSLRNKAPPEAVTSFDAALAVAPPSTRPTPDNTVCATDSAEAGVRAGQTRTVHDARRTGPNCVLYRVVTSDRHMPYSPESGHVLTVTGGTEATDRRPFTSGLRHVQVWVNRGPSEPAARRTQPELHCQETAIAPVRNIDLREDHGSVSCTAPSHHARRGYGPRPSCRDPRGCRGLSPAAAVGADTADDSARRSRAVRTIHCTS